MKEKKKKRKEKLREANKSEILDAAAKVFIKYGYQGATMEKVAAEAGFSASSLYHYFQSKEEIYEQLLLDNNAAFREIIEEVIQTNTRFRYKLHLLVNKMSNLFESRRDFFLLFMSSPFYTIKGFDEKFEKEFRSLLMPIFLQGVHENELAENQVDDSLVFFVGTARAFIFDWLSAETAKPFRAKVSTIVNMFFNGVGKQKVDSATFQPVIQADVRKN